jgi:hypothetical protein
MSARRRAVHLPTLDERPWLASCICGWAIREVHFQTADAAARRHQAEAFSSNTDHTYAVERLPDLQPCDDCRGTGYCHAAPCPVCGGRGQYRRAR